MNDVQSKLKTIRDAAAQLADDLNQKGETAHAAAAQAIYGEAVQALSQLGDAVTAIDTGRELLIETPVE